MGLEGLGAEHLPTREHQMDKAMMEHEMEVGLKELKLTYHSCVERR